MRKVSIGIIIIAVLLANMQMALAKDRRNTAANVDYLSPTEKEIIHEINIFRSNPAQYAKEVIEPLGSYYSGKVLHYPGDIPLRTVEGSKAHQECIRELRKASPLPLLYPNKVLTRAASDHQNDQAKTGKTGHYGSDRSDVKIRIERHGNWHKRIAENIAYGSITPRQIVVFLLIDDGVKDRGHRKKLLSKEFHKIGVAYGEHPQYKTMCVMNFAFDAYPL